MFEYFNLFLAYKLYTFDLTYCYKYLHNQSWRLVLYLGLIGMRLFRHTAANYNLGNNYIFPIVLFKGETLFGRHRFMKKGIK